METPRHATICVVLGFDLDGGRRGTIGLRSGKVFALSGSYVVCLGVRNGGSAGTWRQSRRCRCCSWQRGTGGSESRACCCRRGNGGRISVRGVNGVEAPRAWVGIREHGKKTLGPFGGFFQSWQRERGVPTPSHSSSPHPPLALLFASAFCIFEEWKRGGARPALSVLRSPRE